MKVKDLLVSDVTASEENLKENTKEMSARDLIDGVIYLADTSKFGGNHTGCINILATELKRQMGTFEQELLETKVLLRLQEKINDDRWETVREMARLVMSISEDHADKYKVEIEKIRKEMFPEANMKSRNPNYGG